MSSAFYELECFKKEVYVRARAHMALVLSLLLPSCHSSSILYVLLFCSDDLGDEIKILG